MSKLQFAGMTDSCTGEFCTTGEDLAGTPMSNDEETPDRFCRGLVPRVSLPLWPASDLRASSICRRSHSMVLVMSATALMSSRTRSCSLTAS